MSGTQVWKMCSSTEGALMRGVEEGRAHAPSYQSHGHARVRIVVSVARAREGEC